MSLGDPMPCPKCGKAVPASAPACACGAPVPAPATSPGPAASPAPSPGPDTPASATYRKLRVGDVLDGKWRLESKLGSGGMGAVFLAHDLTLDRKVAVKVLAGHLCNDDEFMTRFEREARMTARLEHPNIVPVFAVGREFGRPFIVMKALEGVTLARLLGNRLAENRLLSREEILPIFRQLCAGLGFIHSKGYVHRDIKAGNVMVGSDGLVTLLDFGVLRDSNARSITQKGALLGTPHYISPEQAMGVREIDGRADLYAVAVLLFEAIALKPPFNGDALTLMKHHAETPPPVLSELRPDVPAAVSEMVQKALSKSPDDRFPTAAEFYAALEAAWGAPAAAAVDAVDAPVAAQSTPVERASAWLKARPAAAAALGVALLGGLVLIGYLSSGSPPPPAPSPAEAAAQRAPEPPPPTPPPPAQPDPALAALAGQEKAPAEPPDPSKPGEAKDQPKPEEKPRPRRVRVVTTQNGEPYWAYVFVNDKPRGETPTTFELAPGKHLVKVQREGFKTVERSVTVAGGGPPIVIGIELTP